MKKTSMEPLRVDSNPATKANKVEVAKKSTPTVEVPLALDTDTHAPPDLDPRAPTIMTSDLRPCISQTVPIPNLDLQTVSPSRSLTVASSSLPTPPTQNLKSLRKKSRFRCEDPNCSPCSLLKNCNDCYYCLNRLKLK